MNNLCLVSTIFLLCSSKWKSTLISKENNSRNKRMGRQTQPAMQLDVAPTNKSEVANCGWVLAESWQRAWRWRSQGKELHPAYQLLHTLIFKHTSISVITAPHSGGEEHGDHWAGFEPKGKMPDDFVLPWWPPHRAATRLSGLGRAIS